MDTLKLYIHQHQIDPEIIDLIQGLHPENPLRMINQNTLQIDAEIDLYEPLDYEEIYNLILTDFDQPTCFILLPKPLHALLTESFILSTIDALPKHYYQGEDYLLTLIKRSKETIPTLQKALSHRLEKSLIETCLAMADANMNLSIAAKKLYMHRNSLHYRIDKIIEETGINIKTFKGLSVFTQLFRH